MLVNRLHAVNFRCFPKVDVELQPGFNLLIGDNGGGKTAILDALTIALSCYFQGFSTGTSLGIDKADVRLALHKLGETEQMPAQYPVSIKCWGAVNGAKLNWERKLKSASRRTGRALTVLGKVGGELDEQMRAGKPIDLPLLAYFGTERVSRERHTRPIGSDGKRDRSLGYKDCLERASNLRLIREWIKRHTLAEAQKSQRGIASTAGEQLRAIEQTVCRCVPEVKQFYYDIEYTDLAVVFDDRRRLPWSMLSDGVRSLATMAMDLAWRAAVLNPHLGAEAPERTAGVVLVDEIDLALHPKWQIRVINDLVRAFPQLQFVTTTHSPLVLAGAKDAHVLQLDRANVYPRQHVYGQDSNTVLSDYMDGPTRAAEVEQQLEATANLIDADRLLEARQAITELETQLGVNNTELVRLRTAIEFLHPPGKPSATDPEQK